MQRIYFAIVALAGACHGGHVTAARPQPAKVAPAVPASSFLAGHEWTKLATTPYAGKQDDIVFVDPDTGWYVNGGGFIYGTTDGGATWREERHQPGTYFRAIGFADTKRGFAGNIGTDYFPGVTDTTPLYETSDGGASWSAVAAITGPPMKGICAIDVLKSRFINAGHLDHRTTIHAAGRVGGPAMMATSKDGGATWTSEDLSSVAGMILDVHFLDERTGFLCAASDADVEKSHARILKTTDGGASWRVVYESTRPWELIWKCAFPTDQVGYATVQSYDERPEIADRVVAKTIDGGEHWTEVPLVKDHAVVEFGVGFADADTGWVGAMDGGWQTTDGGKTWTHVAMGRAVNKIRVVPAAKGFVSYAIGIDVFKLTATP
jgi:photosystem II stability/assembly factor-like uncharacterized protein